MGQSFSTARIDQLERTRERLLPGAVPASKETTKKPQKPIAPNMPGTEPNSSYQKWHKPPKQTANMGTDDDCVERQRAALLKFYGIDSREALKAGTISDKVPKYVFDPKDMENEKENEEEK